MTITDVQGNALKSGLENELPVNHSIRILAPFDGVVQIKRNGYVIEKILLKAETAIEYSNVQYGMKISVLQGLDIIWNIEYQRLSRTVSSSDDLHVVHIKSVDSSALEVTVCMVRRLLLHGRIWTMQII